MAEKAKTVRESFDDLMTAFETTDEKIDKRSGIKAKIILPTPEDKPVTVRLLWSKDDGGNPIAVETKLNDGFRGGKARFMTAEYYDTPGERQLGLNKSLFGSIAAAAGIKPGMTPEQREKVFSDIIGKVGDISASYYTSAPKKNRIDPTTNRGKPCMKCNGAGCPFCTVTGKGTDAGMVTGLQPPTVYTFQLRNDLMNVVPSTGSASAQFE